MAPVCKGAQIPNYKRHNGSWRWTACAFIDSSHSKEGRIWSNYSIFYIKWCARLNRMNTEKCPMFFLWETTSLQKYLNACRHKLKASNPTMRIHQNAQLSQLLVLIAGMKQATVLRRYLEAPESVCPMEKGTFIWNNNILIYTRHAKSRYPPVRKSQSWNKHGAVDPSDLHYPSLSYKMDTEPGTTYKWSYNSIHMADRGPSCTAYSHSFPCRVFPPHLGMFRFGRRIWRPQVSVMLEWCLAYKQHSL